MSSLEPNDSERLALVIEAMQSMETVVDGLVQSVKELAATGREVQRTLRMLTDSFEVHHSRLDAIERRLEAIEKGPAGDDDDEPTAGPIDA